MYTGSRSKNACKADGRLVRRAEKYEKQQKEKKNDSI